MTSGEEFVQELRKLSQLGEFSNAQIQKFKCAATKEELIRLLADAGCGELTGEESAEEVLRIRKSLFWERMRAEKEALILHALPFVGILFACILSVGILGDYWLIPVPTAFLVRQSLWTGRTLGQYELVSRSGEPFNFWFNVTIFALFTLWLIYLFY